MNKVPVKISFAGAIKIPYSRRHTKVFLALWSSNTYLNIAFKRNTLIGFLNNAEIIYRRDCIVIKTLSTSKISTLKVRKGAICPITTFFAGKIA